MAINMSKQFKLLSIMCMYQSSLKSILYKYDKINYAPKCVIQIEPL